MRHIPLELTYAGKVLLRYANDFQKRRAEMRHEFSDISQNQRGHLRVGVAPTRGRTILKRTGIGRPIVRVASHNVGMLPALCLHGAPACGQDAS